MKKFIFFSLLASLAIYANAQNFELGLNAGILVNSQIGNMNPVTDFYRGPTEAYTLKMLRTTKKWQYGLSAEKREASYSYVDLDGRSTAMLVYVKNANKYWYSPYFANVYYPVKFLLNRVISLKRFQFYGGVSAGYIFIKDEQGHYAASDAFQLNKNGSYGYSACMQLGATYFCTKHIGINADLNADYMRFSEGPMNKFQAFAYPLTIGIRYKL